MKNLGTIVYIKGYFGPHLITHVQEGTQGSANIYTAKKIDPNVLMLLEGDTVSFTGVDLE
jgi:hypothetical protein